MKIKISYLLLTLLLIWGCKKEDTPTTTSQTVDTLSTLEKNDLLFLREEEKLARDVYLYAYKKYQLQIFYNISGSEQIHMDAVLDLLKKYKLNDPALQDTGKFSNQQLQQLYDQLTQLVDSSQIFALKVGATIEDLDIRDIRLFKKNTIRTDLLNLYEFLECGSRNHLRAFTKQLNNNNASYTPQYISTAEYDSIINAPKELCTLP